VREDRRLEQGQSDAELKIDSALARRFGHFTCHELGALKHLFAV